MSLAPVRMPAAQAVDQVSRTVFGAAAPRATSQAPEAGSFASLVQNSLSQVNATQAQAETLTHQYQLGQGDVSLEDAMISLQKANISFQTTVQVRNKLVAAYNDVMNMQV